MLAVPSMCEHPQWGTAKAPCPASPFSLLPEQLLGGGSPILSTSCPLGPPPTPIRGAALDQPGQVACKPGAGSGPDYVNEDELGSTNSRCRVTGWRGLISGKGHGPSQGASQLPSLPWLPLVWTLSLAIDPDYPLQPLLPGSQDTCLAALKSSPLLLHMLCPLPVLPSVQSMTNASTIGASQGQARAPLFSGMGATQKALFT